MLHGFVLGAVGDDPDDGGGDDDDDGVECRARLTLELREISFDGRRISYWSCRLRRWMVRIVSRSVSVESDVEVEGDVVPVLVAGVAARAMERRFRIRASLQHSSLP